ncbi:MAG: hypothetical protein CMP37_04320 [Rickettsiales bacterium]|nr:hypothetical protein [Rickettsiales bacterium]|tara:strand:- start:67 stop:531 length:465 start_codon:yes stop_codon:yes gene_type:complete
MKKELILDKLEKLEELIIETDVDQEKVKDKMWLFSKHLMDNKKNIMNIDEERVSTRDLVEIMQQSNIMWNLRNRIADGDNIHTPMYELEAEMMDFIRKQQKINAIKLYRKTMKDDFNIDVTLKESKELVDAMANGVPMQNININAVQPITWMKS